MVERVGGDLPYQPRRRLIRKWVGDVSIEAVVIKNASHEALSRREEISHDMTMMGVYSKKGKELCDMSYQVDDVDLIFVSYSVGEYYTPGDRSRLFSYYSTSHDVELWRAG